MPSRVRSAADLNSRPSTKCCSRWHNFRPLTTFINDRNVELKTCHRCRRPQPLQVECETPAHLAAGDTDNSLVRCSRCMRYHSRSMFLSAAGKRLKACCNCRVCYLSGPLFEIYSPTQESQRAMPGIPIYWDTTVPVHGLTDSLTTHTFATIPSSAVSAANNEVTPEEAQTRQCPCYGGVYPLSVFVDQSRRLESFTNCATYRPQVSRILPPRRTGM
jgi:hypothetical protein